MYKFDPYRFRMYRQKAGLTQTELARLIYMSRRTVEGWEYGRSSPSGEVLLTCARIFKVRPEMLMQEVGTENLRVRKDVEKWKN